MADVDAARAVAGLKEIRRLTEDEDGAQRVAWTDTWITARDWLAGQLAEIDGVTVERDAAGNTWATAPGADERFVIVGGHLDSVPNGGWLDGALNVVAGLEVLRALAPEERPFTLKLVDWADEEGARFGRSLLGSSAAAGTLDPEAVRGLTDRDGTALPDALAAHGVDLDTMRDAGAALEGALAYLELHIEQGPVLEQLDKPLGAVLGTFGVQRHKVASPARTPTPARADAPAQGRVPRRRAQRAGVARRRRGARRRPRHDRRREGHAGDRDGVQRHLRGLARPALARRRRARRHARHGQGGVGADRRRGGLRRSPGSRSGRSSRSCSTTGLIDLADAAIQEVAGTSERLPSGPLHDAAEMARVMPTVMLFVKSLGGVSHTKEEDTPDADLELSVRALYELTRRTLAWAEEAG